MKTLMIIIVALWPCIALAVWPFSSTFYEIQLSITRGTRKYPQVVYSIGKPATEGVFTVYKEYPSGREVRVKTSDVNKIIELEREPSPSVPRVPSPSAQATPTLPASPPPQQAIPNSSPVGNTNETKPPALKGSLENASIAELIPLAENGNIEAQLVLGHNFHHGIRVAQNDSEAFKWFRKASEQGHVIAQCNLADAYLSGEGVEKNPATAFELYQKAANRGHNYAQIKLAQLYEDGLGCKTDHIEALKWAIIASLAEEDQQSFSTKTWLSSGGLVTQKFRLTSEQIQTAEALAREWRAKERN